MIEFYAWPEVICFIITILFAVCVLTQTVSTILSFSRYPRNRNWACEALLELSILLQVFTCSLMHGQFIQAYGRGMIPPTGYLLPRIVIFTALTLLSVMSIQPWLLLTRSRRHSTKEIQAVTHSEASRPSSPLPPAPSSPTSPDTWHLKPDTSSSLHPAPCPLSPRAPQAALVILASGLTLPVAEQHLGRAFAFLFVAALLFWLVRSIRMILVRTDDLRSSISAFSIRNAIDSMNTGVLFCEMDGFVLLSNVRMQRLMEELTGIVQRNGRHFYSLLTLGEIQPGCKIVAFEGQNICLLPDESAWSFSLTELARKKRKYIQLTATDITERWKLTEHLHPQNDELAQRQKDLHEALANVHILSREMATQKAKMRAHDILGERLTMLLRVVRNESAPDYALLHKQSQELLSELKSTGNALTPQEDLEILIQTFAAIGVEVVQDGDPLAGGEHGRVMVDSIKEAVTNAVRDCFATKVLVSLDGTGQGGLLRIAHNGYEEE